jgi:hypothetical protein
VLQEVHRRGLVESRRVRANAQGVRARQLVRCVHLQISRKSCLPITSRKHHVTRAIITLEQRGSLISDHAPCSPSKMW